MPELRLSESAVSDDSTGSKPSLDHAWAALASQGYALTSECEIGLPVKFRENFIQTYFTDAHIRHDPGDWPADRQRARDVVRYWWRGDHLHRLQEYGTIALIDRAGIPGKREHSRVELLEDPQAEQLVRALLSLVPPGRRKRTGTFGINLFRTFTDVVTKPHRDDYELIILYVLGRDGEGAETYLYRPEDVAPDGTPTADPVLRRQLNPGEIIIFDDERFKHGATKLEPPPGGTAMRDVLVCTVDYNDTYLSARAKLRALRARVGSAVAVRRQGGPKEHLRPVA
jgi:2OG-Fe dioxygenase